MRTLRPVALSDDGKSLVLTAEDAEGGEERFELPIDERVRAAARGDARLGAIEDVGNTLPPRVIQARIRAGETPEQVAAASGTRVERIMRFAHPVLQERARIAEQARDARVRLSEGTPTIALQRFMTERLRLLGADGDAVRWDAHRDHDGWVITGAWRAGAKSGTTVWSYDIPARAVTPVDAATRDFAEGTRLVRVVPDVPGGAVAVPAVRRPVAAVPEPEAAVQQSADAEPQDLVRDVTPDSGRPARSGEQDDSPPPFDDDIAEHDTVVLGRPGEDGEAEDPRARIPAWEDIVFGVRRNR
ncbi:MAG: DNA-binding protein [Frankiales bacterium]|nr:DNA-binding protein [Frankiales bacterium]